MTTIPRQGTSDGQGGLERRVRAFAECFHALADNIELVVKGKRSTIELALVCLFSEGHLLIDDVPGTGKTTLARCLAASLEATLHRVQFTPDLLPSDITGVTVYKQDTGAFEFVKGPVFAHIVLSDEINRASPKTQSALLEVMEERQVSADGKTYPVPRPFMVVATQNPVDMSGTYPLPEAQLDRFLMRVSIGYPDHASEIAVLTGVSSDQAVEQLSTMAKAEHIGEFVHIAQQVRVADQLYDYLVRVVAATRELPEVRLGASPRGSVSLLRAVRVRAAAAGRAYAVPEDVKALASPVLAHRLILTPEAELAGRTGEDVMAEVLSTVAVPTPVARVRG